MPLSEIEFLGSIIRLPLRFADPLPFSEEDKADMPWLAQDIRYYGIERELKKGGRATAYIGFIADKAGNPVPKYAKRKIVLKIPSLNQENYTSTDIKLFLRMQGDECGREWQLTRARLRGCKFANPIFDLCSYRVYYLGEPMQMPITAQFFLDDAFSLDEYLLDTRQRTLPYQSKKGDFHDNWHGLTDPYRWIVISHCIAVGLADIHQRRVVHADIWPPNVFMKKNAVDHPIPIFIDFGAAFAMEPNGDSKEERDHAYRAPERSDAQNIVTEQADVYSYGKLLLYLATGAEPILPRELNDYQRRQVIRKIFMDRNPGIVHENPFIIDIVCKCISLDPVDRPSMSDVVGAFHSYVDPTARDSHNLRDPGEIPTQLQQLQDSWSLLMAKRTTRNSTLSPLLLDLVEQRIYEMEKMINGLDNDTIILNNTREQLILALISLFQRMGEDDRFISITSPNIWRSSALGLDGRYFTATILATTRGASIQRTFIFSIQEIGDEWASQLAANLEKNNKDVPAAMRLAQMLRTEIKKYVASRHQGEARDVNPEAAQDARRQLCLIIKSYVDAAVGSCKGKFDVSPEFSYSIKCRGLYIGLLPVSTIAAMRTLKSAYPVGVFYYNNVEEHNRYLLMTTECHARNAGYTIANPQAKLAFERTKPELRGIKVFKSVLGVPEDRIKKMELVFRQSVNIGGWMDQLHRSLPRQEEEEE